jgi:hypothetical protein
VRAILAHGSGIDDLVLFVMPVVVGVGVWLLTRRKAGAEDDAEAATSEGATEANVVPIDPRGKAVSPFHSLMAPAATRRADPDGRSSDAGADPEDATPS